MLDCFHFRERFQVADTVLVFGLADFVSSALLRECDELRLNLTEEGLPVGDALLGEVFEGVRGERDDVLFDLVEITLLMVNYLFFPLSSPIISSKARAILCCLPVTAAELMVPCFCQMWRKRG